MKGWIISYTTLKDGEYKGWGMYVTAENIISAVQEAEKLIQMNPEEYDRYVITDAGIADDDPPNPQKWEQRWNAADPEDFE